MKKSLPPSFSFLLRDVVSKAFAAALLLACMPGLTKAADRKAPPVNQYGAPVLDGQGHRIKYNRKTIEAMARTKRQIEKPPSKTYTTAHTGGHAYTEASPHSGASTGAAAAVDWPRPVLAIRGLWR
jgi:hypothetical protein